MKSQWLILFFVIIVFSCVEKQKQITSSTKAVESKPMDTITSEKYFKPDSLLIKRYKSDSGHKIELRGSLSKDLCKIIVTTNVGKVYNYEIADNWYIASHSQIVWDNDKYIFVRSGCGTGCWYGRVLAISGNKLERDYLNFVYSDSINNIVVYPDTLKSNNLILEKLENKKQKHVEFNLCKEINIPALAFDSIIQISNSKLRVYYFGENCKKPVEKIIEID